MNATANTYIKLYVQVGFQPVHVTDATEALDQGEVCHGPD